MGEHFSVNLHSPSLSLTMNTSKVLPLFYDCDIRSDSHMLPMHLRHGPLYAWNIVPI